MERDGEGWIGVEGWKGMEGCNTSMESLFGGIRRNMLNNGS